MRVQFGECVLDSDTRQLSVRGGVVHLSPKAFQFLELLLKSRPKALSKTEIHEALWPGTFVSDGTLASLLVEVRTAIGDSARNPRFVRTVHRFGYAFCGPLGAPKSAGGQETVFKLLWSDREIALQEGENILGRERDGAAWIDVYSVSRRHARIVVSGESATLEDLGSKNGTFLKGEAVTSPRPLVDGDRLRIGTVEMTIRRYAGAVSTQSVRSSP